MALEYLVEEVAPGRVCYHGFLSVTSGGRYENDRSLSFYPSDLIEVDGVMLRKVNPYVMGSPDILGMVNTYSRCGMVLEGLTGEELEKTVMHEVYHANQRPNNEMITRQNTFTEEAKLNPCTCVRNY